MAISVTAVLDVDGHLLIDGKIGAIFEKRSDAIGSLRLSFCNVMKSFTEKDGEVRIETTDGHVRVFTLHEWPVLDHIEGFL